MTVLTTRLAAAIALLGSVFASDARITQVLRQYTGGHSGLPEIRAGNSSSASVYNTAFPGVTWDPHNWRLTSSVFDQGHYQSRGSVANGYMGLINSAGAGPFFEVDVPVNGDNSNGWPLFSRRQAFAGVVPANAGNAGWPLIGQKILQTHFYLYSY